MTTVPQERSLAEQLVTFAVIGVVGTAAYLLVYAALREVLPAQVANTTSRIAIAIPTTWLNGRHTFGSRVSLVRLYGGAVVVVAVGIALTGAALAVEQALAGPDVRSAELATLAAATVLVTGLRFLLMRQWLFRHRPPTPLSPVTPQIPPSPEAAAQRCAVLPPNPLADAPPTRGNSHVRSPLDA